MKRYLFVLIMAIVCYGVTVAQPALIASEDDQEIMSIIFNPEWVKAHNIKEIATTVFYAQKTDPKNYITTTKIFDSSGYQTIEFDERWSFAISNCPESGANAHRSRRRVQGAFGPQWRPGFRGLGADAVGNA